MPSTRHIKADTKETSDVQAYEREKMSLFDNDEFMMFIVVPALLLPVGWAVTKILNYYEN